MADEAGTTEAAADASAAPTGQAPAEAWKPPTREEWEASRKALEDVRKEAAERRVKTKEAEALAADEAKRAAEAAGKWDEVVKLTKAEAEAARKEAEEVKGKAAKADAYESYFAGKAQALREQLGDKAPPIPDSLPLSEQVRTLEWAAAQFLGARPAPSKPVSGNPAATQASPQDLDSMSAADRTAYLASLGRAGRQQLLAARSGEPVSVPRFARIPK